MQIHVGGERERGWWWGRNGVSGHCRGGAEVEEEGVAAGPALFCLLQDEIIAETVHFITESLFTRWLWGKCEDEGASVKLASPRVGFGGACGISRRVV